MYSQYLQPVRQLQNKKKKMKKSDMTVPFNWQTPYVRKFICKSFYPSSSDAEKRSCHSTAVQREGQISNKLRK